MRHLFFVAIFFFIAGHAQARDAIVYSHLVDDTWQIFVMDADGKNKRQVTTSPEDKRGPTWLGGGRKIAYRTSNSRLYTVDIDGKNEEQILKKYDVVTNPSFSKVNNEIVFVRFDPRGKDRADIWKSDVTGEKSKLLTSDKIGKFQPRFSRQGDKIVFVQRDKGMADYHVWVMNSDGTGARQLTFGAGFDTHPDFSPDQSSVVFCSNRLRKGYDIYMLGLKDMALKQLTRHPGANAQPRFSSDGKKIVFVSDRSGSQQIWVMNSDGSGAAALTNEETEAIDPEWGERD